MEANFELYHFTLSELKHESMEAVDKISSMEK